MLQARKGNKVTYSGDTTPCEEMIEFAKDSTLLIHESTYVNEDADKAKDNFHSTSSDAARIAKKSNSKQLVLTHFSTRYTSLDDLLKEAKEIFENTKLAKDFQHTPAAPHRVFNHRIQFPVREGTCTALSKLYI